MDKFITGIGTRKINYNIDPYVKVISCAASALGWTLRSGGAEGMDDLFEKNYYGPKEIYLPWKGFNKNKSLLFGSTEEAKTLAAQFHPKWLSLSSPAKELMGRNSHQVLGKDLKTKSDCVVCATQDGQDSGGTGQALRIARYNYIPIFNLRCCCNEEYMMRQVLSFLVSGVIEVQIYFQYFSELGNNYCASLNGVDFRSDFFKGWTSQLAYDTLRLNLYQYAKTNKLTINISEYESSDLNKIQGT